MKTTTQRSMDLKKIILLAMFSAIAYVLMLVGRVPISSVDFLKYDPKDIIILIGGFIYGPMAAFIISAVVSLIEMLTVSTTWLIGYVMNVLSTVAFACTASYIYRKNQTIKNAVVGLIAGVLCMTAMMLMWNYFITPIYMGISREAVAAMLVPIFLPFNLLKGTLNATFTMLLYKPLIGALRSAGVVPPSSASAAPVSGKARLGTVLVSLVVLASCVLAILVIRGTI